MDIRPNYNKSKLITVISLIFILISCGGGNDGSGANVNSRGGTGSSSDEWTENVFPASSRFAARCASPRTDINPGTGIAWPDVQGTALDEKNWLRSWSNELYLWYDEIIDRSPAPYGVLEYFALLKTEATLPSGRPKDDFHFTYDTDEWNQLSQSGVSSGYGLSWAVINRDTPRDIRVAHTEPGTAATEAPASLERGDRLLEINGIDVVNSADFDTISHALSPSNDGESYSFTFEDLDAGQIRTFTMTSGSFTMTPVQFVKTIPTANGDVGYMLFKSHIAIAQEQLVNGVEQLVAEGIADLVLDLRYNGGGYLAMASQLAYMIAGNAQTQGEIFSQTQFNDKHPVINPVTGQPLLPVPFYSTTLNYSSSSVFSSQPLPTLNLNRVFILTGPGTCSASESLINGLRGVDVEVIQIGSTTCGKPYGFYPADNCGTTYFTIQFTGVNAKGFGEFSDGFSPQNTNGVAGTVVPGCEVADDYTHDFGDPDEARLAAALAYRDTGACPAPPAAASGGLQKTALPSAAATDGYIRTEPALQVQIMDVKHAQH